MEKLLSVIVPVYQGEKTIGRCIRSILNSSYKNLEIIVVDDGSCDKTADLVEKMAEQDSRIVFLKKENGGVSAARNTGLLHARGDYIGFVDADDFIDKTMYEKMADAMQDSCDMVICGSYHCDMDGVPEKHQKKFERYQKICPVEALNTVIYEKTTMAVWSKLFRREKIVDKKGNLLLSFRENQNRYEDFVFICEYITACRGTIRLLPERLYYYCFRKDSLSRQKTEASVIKENLKPVLALKKKIREKSFTAPELFYTETFVKQWYFQIIMCSAKERKLLSKDSMILKKEAGRYAEKYIKSEQPAWFKKAAVWLMFRHGKIAEYAAEMAGTGWKLYQILRKGRKRGE
jgi:glycosyltransferase involved in cell wall biosynthesis